MLPFFLQPFYSDPLKQACYFISNSSALIKRVTFRYLRFSEKGLETVEHGRQTRSIALSKPCSFHMSSMPCFTMEAQHRPSPPSECASGGREALYGTK